jgi:Niemann-Pick C1 protein
MNSIAYKSDLEITLFINVILPFLILAVGLDNIFILVDTLATTDPALVPVERVAEALSHAGSSMLTVSLAEALTFLLGCWSKMPAVKAFAVYAGVAVVS